MAVRAVVVRGVHTDPRSRPRRVSRVATLVPHARTGGRMTTQDDDAGAAPVAPVDRAATTAAEDATATPAPAVGTDPTLDLALEPRTDVPTTDEAAGADADAGTDADAVEAPGDDARQRRRARVVTLTIVGVITLGAVAEVEAWPVTAFRLFSQVRTDTSSSLQLVVVRPDGATSPLTLKPADDVVVITGHQYATLRDLPPARQRAKVDAWLALGGVDRADVATVRLDRVTLHYDAAADRWVETKRVTVTEVAP